MDPEHIKLAQIAHDTVLRTMQEGEQTHPGNEWQQQPEIYHLIHATTHIASAGLKDTSEDHIGHALTRLAMIKYLQK